MTLGQVYDTSKVEMTVPPVIKKSVSGRPCCRDMKEAKLCINFVSILPCFNSAKVLFYFIKQSNSGLFLLQTFIFLHYLFHISEKSNIFAIEINVSSHKIA